VPSSHRRRLLGVIGCLAITLSLAPTALAKAETGKFDFSEQVTDPTALPECMPADLADMVGEQEATETFHGTFVENRNGFHIEGSADLVYRVDFLDGRYVTGAGLATFHLNVDANGQATDSEIIREPRTIYAADGQVIGHVQIHALTHISYRDVNGNGEPDPGEFSVSRERFFFTCRQG
jgi:hypothetical protein